MQVIGDSHAGGLDKVQIRATIQSERRWNTNNRYVRRIEHARIGAGDHLIVDSQGCDFAIAHVRHWAASAGYRVDLGRIDVETDYGKTSVRELHSHRQPGVAEPDDRNARLSCA